MVVAEVYSPPRVVVEAAKRGLKVGESMDLTTGSDFRKLEHRKQARQYIDTYKPKLLIGSPMCTMFSNLQNLPGWGEDKQRRWCEAKLHIQFVCELCEQQIKEGRWFLHEHPAGASSWDLDEVKKIEENMVC